MKTVSFIKTPEELAYFDRLLNDGGIIRNQEGLFVAWKTKPEIIQRLVPPPLEATSPLVLAYVAYIFETNFWKDYNESALLIPVQYRGRGFSYFLAMPIAGKNDMPIVLGREQYGFPKKNADELGIFRSGDDMKVWVERNGVRFFEAEAEIGDYNDPEAEAVFAEFRPGAVVIGNNVNFRFSIENHENRVGFANVRLEASPTATTYRSVEKARIAGIRLTPSLDDPWAELEVVQPLGATYFRSDATFGITETVAELDAEDYAPYLFNGYDSSVLGHTYRNFRITK